MKVTQNININQQIAEAIARGEINVTINQVNHENKAGDIHYTDDMAILQTLLRRLPETRIDNLVLAAMQAATMMCGSRTKAAAFLGVSESTVCRYLNGERTYHFSKRCQLGSQVKAAKERNKEFNLLTEGDRDGPQTDQD